MKAPAEFTLMMYSFLVNTLTYCAMLLGSKFVKENIYKIKLEFIVYFDGKYVTWWRCPNEYHLNRQIVEMLDWTLKCLSI